MENVQIEVEKIVKENIKIDNQELDYDQDLTEIGMESIVFIQIIVSIEERFSIVVPDDDLIIENFNTINKISEQINLLKYDK